jgi:hypothetical protein
VIEAVHPDLSGACPEPVEGSKRVLTQLDDDEPDTPEHEAPKLRVAPDGSTSLTMNGFV